LTKKLQVAVFPDESVPVWVTVVWPSGKVEPEGGLPATVRPGQLSLDVAIE
jgi:hypothetical protein